MADIDKGLPNTRTEVKVPSEEIEVKEEIKEKLPVEFCIKKRLPVIFSTVEKLTYNPVFFKINS